jgi:hypothetical protein
MSSIASSRPSSPMSCAQGRHGEVIIAQRGERPLRWDGSGVAVTAGVDAPASPASIEADDTPNYHIARIDVSRPGAVYGKPPKVRLVGGDLDPAAGRPCVAKSYLSQSAVSEILIEDGGKYYAKPPTALLGPTQEEIDAGASVPHGHGAVIKAELDRFDPLVSGGNSAETGVTGYDLISDGPPWAEEEGFIPEEKVPYGIYNWVDVDLVNGEQAVDGPTFYYGSCLARARATIRVTGITSGSGARVRIFGTGWEWLGCETSGVFTNSRYNLSTGIGQVVPLAYGEGYSRDDTITIRVVGIQKLLPGQPRQRPAPPEYDAVIRAYVGDDPNNPSSRGYQIRSLSITDGGDGYLVAPRIQIVSNTGFGAYATCTVKDGAIDTVTLENPGGGYKVPPEVRILSGGAEAAAIARPHLRGLYQCYYRYIDATPEESGGPIPSNLSEVVEVDAGEHATSLTWTVAPPTGRAVACELWRSTGNQALTLYRVATIDGSEPFVDDLTDEELRDADREGYEAMPVVLPNGELNANRFTPPPPSEVVVRFQDRFWYGVGLAKPNAIYFSELDEPESVPDVNEIIPMSAGNGADVLTALIPFGTTLLLMQSRHCYGLTFSRQPLLDAQVIPQAYRGCVNQRSWGIHDGVLYVMDQSGVYAMDQSGGIKSLSDAIEDHFRSKIDWGSSKWNFIAIDPRTKTLRAFVCHTEDNASTYPSRCFCYSLDSNGWWVEVYPQLVTGASPATMSGGEYRCVYASESGPVLLDEGSTDIARGAITSVKVTSGGAGYKTPPSVSVSGGAGAKLQATLDGSGRVQAIWVLRSGRGYESGSIEIGPPNDPDHPSPVQASASFTASPLSEDTPVSPVCLYRGGTYEYPTDDTDTRLGGVSDRSISVTYAPLERTNEISIRAYYNGSKTPRQNVAERDRGTGFRHDSIDPAARLDIGGDSDLDGGVAKASFSGSSSGDMRGTDRHVSVEVIAPRRNNSPVVLYQLDVYGSGK